MNEFELLEDRNTFVAWCVDHRYEFSSLRRATFSTMCMLYKLISNNQQGEQEDSKEAAVELCVETLKHACACNDPGCTYDSCAKMKNFLQHVKNCTKRSEDNRCNTCHKAIAIIRFHAKRCTVTKCPVPFCLVVRLKRSKQMIVLRLRHQLTQRRVTATIIRSTL